MTVNTIKEVSSVYTSQPLNSALHHKFPNLDADACFMAEDEKASVHTPTIALYPGDNEKLARNMARILSLGLERSTEHCVILPNSSMEIPQAESMQVKFCRVVE